MAFSISECEIDRGGKSQKCLKVLIPDEESSGMCIFNIPVSVVDELVRSLIEHVGLVQTND